MENYHGLNIRTSVLGQDAHMSEYWFFKDDPQRLYIKKQVAQSQALENIDEQADAASALKYQWYFIDDEDQFDQLFDSFNLKGIREKKLLESLKKVRVSLKMKKAKKVKNEDEQGDEPKDQAADQSDESDQIMPGQESPRQEDQDERKKPSG